LGESSLDGRIVAEDTGVQVYFCDPNSPWRRGSIQSWPGNRSSPAARRRLRHHGV